MHCPLYSSLRLFSCLLAIAVWPVISEARAFTWHVDRHGELVTLPVDQPVAAPSEAASEEKVQASPDDVHPDQQEVRSEACCLSGRGLAYLAGVGLCSLYFLRRIGLRRPNQGSGSPLVDQTRKSDE